MLRFILIVFIFLMPVKQIQAQYLTIGTGGAYNAFILQGGYDFRLGLEKKRWGLVADYYHYGAGHRLSSDIVPVNEYYIVLNGKFNVINRDHFKAYLLGGYLFTKWINETRLGPGTYQGINMGGGFEYRFSKLAAFFETSTNTVWWETNSQLGIKMYVSPTRIFRDGLKKRYNLDLQNDPSKQ